MLLPRVLITAVVAVGLSAIAAAGTARAGDDDHRDAPDDSARCRRIQAEAESSAYLLYAPSFSGQLVHLPAVGDVSPTGLFPGDGYQARAVVSFSPLDVYRGRRVMAAADAECSSQRSAERIRDVLAFGSRYGKLKALRAQITYLEDQSRRIDRLVSEAEVRIERGVGTVLERDELRLRELRLQRTLSRARQELAMLEQEHGDEVPDRSLPLEMESYERHTMAMERERSTIRRLSAWQVDVQLGAAPGDELDWYGVLAVSYDFGDLFQRGAEQRYLRARSDELQSSENELRSRLERFRRVMAASASDLQKELSLVEEQIDLLKTERARLSELPADDTKHRLAVAELDLIRLEADRVYLRRLVDRRKAVGTHE